jgi:hypothetical protein
LIVERAHEAGALRSQDLKRVTVDTTVQPKAITFPTDAKLLHAAIKKWPHSQDDDFKPFSPAVPGGATPEGCRQDTEEAQRELRQPQIPAPFTLA